MSIQNLKDALGDHAKDAKVNLGNLLTEEGSVGLTLKQIYGIALACSYSLGSHTLSEALESEAKTTLDANDILGAKSAASIMGMNNIYYRFIHLAGDHELANMPAKLRMQVIGKPPVDKITFELMSLAVSALTGCENCIKAHIAEVKKGGVTLDGVQSAGRLASVIHATYISHRIPS